MGNGQLLHCREHCLHPEEAPGGLPRRDQLATPQRVHRFQHGGCCGSLAAAGYVIGRVLNDDIDLLFYGGPPAFRHWSGEHGIEDLAFVIQDQTAIHLSMLHDGLEPLGGTGSGVVGLSGLHDARFQGFAHLAQGLIQRGLAGFVQLHQQFLSFPIHGPVHEK